VAGFDGEHALFIRKSGVAAPLPPGFLNFALHPAAASTTIAARE